MFIGYANAGLYYDIEQNTDNTNWGTAYSGQAFKPTVYSRGYISGITLRATPVDVDIDLKLCKGNIGGRSESELLDLFTDDYCDIDIFVASTTCTLTGNAVSKCYFDRSYGVVEDEWYYFAYIKPTESIKAKSGNPYADGHLFYHIPGCGSYCHLSDYDLRFQTFYDDTLLKYGDEYSEVEIVDIGDQTPWNIYVGSEEYLDILNPQTCFTNEDCYFEFGYSFDAIGDDILLYEFEDTTNEIASSTLGENYIMKEKYLLEEKATPYRQEYCLESTNLNEIYCGLYVNWVDFVETYDCSEETVCYDVNYATSSFMFGINCGMKRALCWAITPKAETFYNLNKTIEEFQTNFPFSVYYDIYGTFANMYEATTTPLNIPIVWQSENELEQIATATIDKNLMINSISSKYDTWYSFMETIIYFFGFYIIIHMFWNLGHKEEA